MRGSAAATSPTNGSPKPTSRQALAGVAARLVAEGERYAASARNGTPALGFRSAWAVLAAADIYGGIGRQVAKLGSRAWHARVSTSATAKLAAVAQALP